MTTSKHRPPGSGNGYTKDPRGQDRVNGRPKTVTSKEPSVRFLFMRPKGMIND